MRATGKDGFLYSIKFGEPIVGGSEVKIETAGFYKIKSKASEGSGIPSKNPLDVLLLTPATVPRVHLMM